MGGGANSLAFNIIPEAWEQNEEIWNNGKMYALAFSYDPLTHHRLGPIEPFKLGAKFGKLVLLAAVDNPALHDPKLFIDKSREIGNLPCN